MLNHFSTPLSIWFRILKCFHGTFHLNWFAFPMCWKKTNRKSLAYTYVQKCQSIHCFWKCLQNLGQKYMFLNIVQTFSTNFIKSLLEDVKLLPIQKKKEFCLFLVGGRGKNAQVFIVYGNYFQSELGWQVWMRRNTFLKKCSFLKLAKPL